MHPSEIDDVMKTMVCIIDSREQNTPKLRRRMKQIELPIERTALNAGDYSAKLYLPDGKEVALPVAIERKYDLTELCMCFCQERSRFEREFKRAREAQTRLYLLVENATWENVYAGKYRSRMASKSLVASILSYLARYDCKLIFCKEELSGRMIRDILHYEAREYLESLVDE